MFPIDAVPPHGPDASGAFRNEKAAPPAPPAADAASAPDARVEADPEPGHARTPEPAPAPARERHVSPEPGEAAGWDPLATDDDDPVVAVDDRALDGDVDGDVGGDGKGDGDGQGAAPEDGVRPDAHLAGSDDGGDAIGETRANATGPAGAGSNEGRAANAVAEDAARDDAAPASTGVLSAYAHLPTVLASALAGRGYATLTPVQAAVADPQAAGRDLLVSAQTGSGKTVAFGLAMADVLLDDAERPARAPAAPAALVVAPTRELALQVARELSWLYGPAGIVIGTCVGGMDAGRERRALMAGTHIVVGTPGRLRDHLERGALELGGLGIVVLDEADEMLDMGFREDLEELLDAAAPGRRTLMFSATMPRPIALLAKRYQRDALTIATAGADRGHGDIDYRCVTVAPADIENAVVNLLRLHDAPTAMLFCATRDNVRHLHASLTDRGFGVVALSGEMSQTERNRALQALRDRRARVCVATDVAARGIDLPTLSLVIHVELPRDAETLQHRSGRTGRAGRQGTAVLVVPVPRRRRVEGMLRAARIAATWEPAPGPDAIRAADRDRLLATIRGAVIEDEEDRALGAALLAERPAEELAALLVAAHRAHLPAPEELIDVSARAGRAGRIEADAGDGTADGRPDRRDAFGDAVWFAMDIGRRHNADPRWLLPLLCRRGHVTRGDIGAIRIGPNETAVQIAAGAAARFAAAVKRTATEDGGEGAVRFVRVAGEPEGRGERGPKPERRTLSRGPGGPGTPARGGPPRGGPRSGPGGRPGGAPRGVPRGPRG